MLFEDFAFKIMNTKDYSKVSLWIPKILLSRIFLWPGTNNYRLKSTISFVLAISLQTFTVIGAMQNFTSLDSIIDLVLIMGFFQSIFKMFTIWYHLDDLKFILDEIMARFWPYDLIDGKTKENLKQFSSFITLFMIPLHLASILVFIIYIVPPLLQPERLLPFHVKYSFDWSVSPVYEIMFLSHVIGLALLVISVIGVDMLFVSIVMSTVIQYRLLQQCLLKYNTSHMTIINERFNNFENGPLKHVQRKSYFVKCVEQHQFLLRFIKKTNQIFNTAFVVQFSASIICICIANLKLVQSIGGQLYTPFVFMMSYLNELLIYCFTSNMLSYEASLLPEFIYRSNWRSLENKETKRDVMFLLLHSQRPLQMTVMNLYEVNMTSYLKILRHSFSFYTFLNTFISK